MLIIFAIFHGKTPTSDRRFHRELLHPGTGLAILTSIRTGLMKNAVHFLPRASCLIIMSQLSKLGHVANERGKLMNEQENTHLVQQFYQSQKTGDMESLLNSMARDIQWVVPEMENVPFAGTWQGREGVRKFFSIVSEVQDVVEFASEEYIAQGNKVVVLGRFTMRIKATGRNVSSTWAHVWTLENGQIIRFYEYVDTAVVSSAHTVAKTAVKTG